MADEDWRSFEFRQKVLSKINEAISSSDLTPKKNTVDMENHVFSKARNKDEYLSFVARLIIHVREMNNKNKNPDGAGNSQGNQSNAGNQQQQNNPGIQDPINALQNLASQGTRSPQMMNQQQGVPGGQMMANQQQVPGMQQAQGNMQNQGPMIRGQVPQPGMQQQVPGMMQPQMSAMNPMQMGQIGPGQVVNAGQVRPNMQPNQQANAMNQMAQNQMMGNVQGNMMNMNQGGQMPVQGNIPGNQPQMNPMMSQNQLNAPNQMMMMGNPNQNPMINVRPTMGPNMAAQNNMMNAGQQPMPMGMQPMRNKEMMMPNQFPQVRSVTPNFLRQSPSPMSVPSPIGLSSQHGIASPAMVPSPQAPLSNQPRVGMQNVMAPSPSAPMNTPGQPQTVQSPMNPADDQIYREKYNRLTKYKEPLKKMISRVGSDGINSEKIIKLKKLLEILSNPDTRIPLETLVKCEYVLENQFGALKDAPTTSINNPLYDAIVNNLQNAHLLGIKTASRWFGPDIKNLPPAKKRRLSEDQVVPSLPNEIPHILQREIARLNSKFKINLDQTTHTAGSKMIGLVCCLDDKHLPPVPPIHIVIPEDYPSVSPQCNIVDLEYDDTQFLVRVKKALKARVSKLPTVHSLTHILETWCLAIRQACNPNYVEPSHESVLLAV